MASLGQLDQAGKTPPKSLENTPFNNFRDGEPFTEQFLGMLSRFSNEQDILSIKDWLAKKEVVFREWESEVYVSGDKINIGMDVKIDDSLFRHLKELAESESGESANDLLELLSPLGSEQDLSLIRNWLANKKVVFEERGSGINILGDEITIGMKMEINPSLFNFLRDKAKGEAEPPPLPPQELPPLPKVESNVVPPPLPDSAQTSPPELQNLEEEPKFGMENVNGINIWTTKLAAGHSTYAELRNVKDEIDGALQDLSQDEMQRLQSNDFTISIKDSSLTQPLFHESNSMLDIGVKEIGRNILNAIRTIVIPALEIKFNTAQVKSLQEPPPLPEIENVVTPPPLSTEPLPPPLPVEEMATPPPLPENKTPETSPEDLDFFRIEYIRRLRQSQQKAGAVENSLNLDFTEAEDKYYKSLEQERQKIEKEVYEKYGISDKENTDMDRIMSAIVETKRRVMDELVEIEHHKKVTIVEGFRKEEGSFEKCKLYMQKGLEWYGGTNKYARLFTTTALLSLGGFLTGFGVAGVASYAVLRTKRGLGSIAGVTATSALMQKRWLKQEKEIETKSKEKKEKLAEDFGGANIRSTQEKYGKIEKETALAKRKHAIKKSAVILGVGGLAGFTAGAIESGGENALPIKEPSVTPKPLMPEEVKGIVEAEKSAPRIVELKQGGSVWKLTEIAAAENPRFSSLDEAQKSFIVSSFSNEAVADPTAHGLPPKGNLLVGDKIDVSKLISNKTDLDKLIDKALKMPEIQKSAILERNYLIQNWLESHPNEPLTPDKVTEILTGPREPNNLAPEQVNVAAERPILEPIKSEIGQSLPSHFQPDHAEGKTPVSSTELENQVAEVKKMPGNNVEAQIEKPDTLPKERSMMGDFLEDHKIREAFENDVNQIYSKSKMLGLVKEKGLNTEEWKFISKLPAKRVIDFGTQDSALSDLSPEVKIQLADSPLHRKMIDHLNKLVKAAGGAVKPFENENMETFIKRLGGYIMKKGTA